MKNYLSVPFFQNQCGVIPGTSLGTNSWNFSSKVYEVLESLPFLTEVNNLLNCLQSMEYFMDNTFFSADCDITNQALIVGFRFPCLNHYLSYIPKRTKRMDKEFESWLK